MPNKKPGRPKGDPTKPVTLRLTKRLHDEYIAIGGARWAKRLLNEAANKNGEKMNDDKMLIEAQKHMECVNEALNELWIKKPDADRTFAINEEISCRLWAAIYLVQATRTGSKDASGGDSFEEVMRDARAYDSELDGPVDTSDMH